MEENLEEREREITKLMRRKFYLTDEIEALRLHIEELHRHWEVEPPQRSRRHGQIQEEREEREAVGGWFEFVEGQVGWGG